uniref:Uncharacterized protein n=1 Tax=Caenorhabditis japonica TaxID=281687 RepID=A0A8R1IDJ6_CAEJA
MEDEKKRNTNVWISYAVIDKFDNYCAVVEQCRQVGHVDIKHFHDLLGLRDEVLKCIQNYLRIGLPVNNKKTPVYPTGIDELYAPYDYEFLCGNVISGE